MGHFATTYKPFCEFVPIETRAIGIIVFVSMEDNSALVFKEVATYLSFAFYKWAFSIGIRKREG